MPAPFLPSTRSLPHAQPAHYLPLPRDAQAAAAVTLELLLTFAYIFRCLLAGLLPNYCWTIARLTLPLAA